MDGSTETEPSGDVSKYDSGDEDSEDSDPEGMGGPDEMNGYAIKLEVDDTAPRIMRLEADQNITWEDFSKMIDDGDVAYAALLMPHVCLVRRT
ncbi:hypothetical protein HK097_007922 [Rhizophlyctis rosea]|uniref:Uncharacterized protein n=1 Tax=Rhizophlyctis rosea TaxID=64517 RepID=A0AAD5SCI9_9FUNG|nr:hypothetical protein HK097_007922 [Rhizophlyctis rosea]